MKRKFGQLSRAKIIRVVNATINEYNESATLKVPVIDANASSHQQDKAFVMAQSVLGANLIMTNIRNAIRYQLYTDLKDEKILSDFDFYRNAAESGAQIIAENTPEGSARTGDIAADLDLISGEPLAETLYIEFANNFAIDLKMNKNIQTHATLKGYESWLNNRVENQTKGIDKHLHGYILSQIDQYAGYREVVIDISDISADKEAIALRVEETLGQEVLQLGADYNSLANEEYDTAGDPGTKFDNLVKAENIGLIVKTEQQVQRVVRYFRNLRNGEGMGAGEENWGVGHIINKPLTGENTIIGLAKNKFTWGAEFDAIDSTHGHALVKNLRTEYTMYGSGWLLSAPAFRITTIIPPLVVVDGVKRFGTTEENFETKEEFIRNHMVSSKKARRDEFVKLLEKDLAAVKKNDNDLSDKDKKLAESQIEKVISAFKKADFNKMADGINLHFVDTPAQVVEVEEVVEYTTLDAEKELQSITALKDAGILSEEDFESRKEDIASKLQKEG